MASSAHIPAVRSGAIRRAPRTAVGASVAGVTACLILLGLAWRAGGYFPDATLGAGGLAFAVLAVLIPLRPAHLALPGPALLGAGALAGLAAWTALSARWSSLPDVALEDFHRTLCLVGLFGLGLVATSSARGGRRLAWLMLAVAIAIVGAGLASRLLPGWFAPGVQEEAWGYRLAYPLSYWNAFGALGAVALVLGAGLAADPRAAPPARGLAAAAAVLAGTAGYLSFSRGSWLALVAGLAVLAALNPRPVRLAVTLLLVGATLAMLVLVLDRYDGLTVAPGAGAGQAAEGRAFLPLLILLAAGCGTAQALLAAAQRRRPRGRRAAARPPARTVRLVGGLAAAIALAGYLAFAAPVERVATAGLDRSGGWVSRQWTDFLGTAPTPGQGAARLVSAKGTRSDLYRVAVSAIRAHPLLGDGAGGFQVRYAHERRVEQTVRDAHSLYLEVPAELGIVGAALLAAFLGALGWAVVRARRQSGGLGRSHVAAVGGAVAVWAAHAAVDWDWQVPALTGLVLVLAASLLVPAEPSGRRR